MKLHLIISVCAGFLTSLSVNAQHLVWARQIGGPIIGYTTSITRDAAGNIYATGNFSGTVDFDEGPGTFNLTTNNEGDVFVLKMDSSGNFLWARNMGGPLRDMGDKVAIDPLGNVVVSGYLQDTADFDPGPATFNLISNGNYDCFVTMLDASGNFIWAVSWGGIGLEEGVGLTLDLAGNIYVTGGFSDTVDFDPGPGTFILGTLGVGSDPFLSKLDNAGNLIWVKQFTHNLSYGSAHGTSIAIDDDGNVITAGW